MNTPARPSVGASALCLLCAAFAIGGAHAQSPYRLTLLDTGSDLIDMGINDNGQVVFSTFTAVMVWDGTTMINLGPGAGLAINEIGQVAGYQLSSGLPSATVWTQGQPTTLSSAFSLVRDINNQGQAVGFDGIVSVPQAAVWTSGNVQILAGGIATAINDAGQIVGNTLDDAGGGRPVLWSGGATTFLDTVGSATDINNRGQIIGVGASGRPTLWDGPVAVELGTFGAYQGSPLAINDAGQVVGTLALSPDVRDQCAALWDGTAVTDLNSLLRPQTSAAGWVLASAVDINNQGSIVGLAYNRSEGCVPIMCDAHVYVLSISDLPDQLPDIPAAIPEPSTYALMLAGLGAIGMWAQRRRAASASR